MGQTRPINQAGMDLIKSFEGLRLTSYWDPTGQVWTIGYGDTLHAHANQTITEEEATEFLQDDLLVFESGVTRLVTSSINDYQYSALVSFSYNVGLGNLKNSTLLKLVNASQFDQCPDEFLKWDRSGGQVIPGLERRRQAEADLFMTPVDPTTISA